MVKRTVSFIVALIMPAWLFAQSWIDVTDVYIVNPRFDNDDVTTGWTGTGFGTYDPMENAEHYNKTYDTYQTISGLNAGTYRLSLQAFYRMGSATNDYELYSSNNYADYQYAELYASSSTGFYSTKIAPASSAALKNSLGGAASTVPPNQSWWGGDDGLEHFQIPNNMEAAYYWFKAGYYKNSVECEVGKDGTLTIGIQKSNIINEDWTCLDNWQLEYYGTVINVSYLNLKEKTLNMMLGETHKLNYTLLPTTATYKKVTWTSSDESILKVDQDGNVTAVGTGTAQITVAAVDGSNRSSVCTVTVINNPSPESIVINEIMPSNTDMFVDPTWNYGGWVEIYNPSNSPVSLSHLYVSDDANNLKKFMLKLEVGTVPAHGFKTLWFDHIDTRKDVTTNYVNTNVDFKLNVDGGTFYISDNDGNLITSQTYPQAMMRVSYARRTDGGEEWGYTSMPTPDSSNNNSVFSAVRLDEPIVDKGGQLFDGTLQVCVNIPAGATLRYTTDGTVPTLTNGSTSTTGLFTVSTTTCYRFRLFQDGYLPSVVTTRSYILRDRDYYLPVVSVVTDPKNLYDNTIGAYVSGSNGKTANQDGTARNFNMEWDRPVNFEYIVNNDQEVINQMVDYAISGGWSRKYTPRPFKLKSAKQYEINELGYAFFADKPYNKYKNILMRNGGNDEYNQTRLKDVALQEIARQSEFKLNLQSFQPAHVFYNGQYIAMLNMREVTNKQYAYSNYGYDTDEVDAFEICVDSGYVQKSGTREAFERLYDLTVNASDEGTYEEIRKLLDIDDFINYMAFKFFLNDWDWPHNNFKAFRSRNDGRFHFVVFDLDNCVDRTGNNIFNDFERKQTNTFYQRPEYGWTSLTKEVEIVTIFLNLLNNEQFKKQFIDTYCIVGGCVFRDADEIAQIVNSIASSHETALSWENHSPWGTGRSFAQGIINAITGNFKKNMTNVIQNYGSFDLYSVQQQAVKLSTNINSGKIYVNDLEVPKSLFDGYLFAPVKLRAAAPAGYKFSGWNVNGSGSTVTSTIFDFQSDWLYYDQGSLDGSGWEQSSYNTSSWTKGIGGFGYGRSGRLMSEANTILDKGPDASNVRPTYYVRKEFTLNEEPLSTDVFTLHYQVDDGMIVYVNGQEAGMYHMVSGASYNQYTEDFNGSWYELDNPLEGTITINNKLLKKGKNVIAVEVHNCINTSSDLWWDASLIVSKTVDNSIDLYSTEEEIDLPEGENLNIVACYEKMSDSEIAEAHLTPLRVNEVSASNSIYINDYQKKNDWVEIYNTTDEDIDIEGMYLSDNENKPYKYQISKGESNANTIVPAHGYILIWCDKLDPISQLHATFKLAAEGGVVMLSDKNQTWTDTLRYPAHNGDNTVGRYPNGTDSVYVMQEPTIAKSNVLNSYAQTASQEKAEDPDAIEETFITSNNGMRIYSANGEIVIHDEESQYVDVTIYSVSGQEILNTRLPLMAEYATLHLTPLPTGAYIVKALDTEGNMCSMKYLYK